jgi:hypothetical protein
VKTDKLTKTSSKLPVLDAEGYTVCPDCDSRVNCGTIGLANQMHPTRSASPEVDGMVTDPEETGSDEELEEAASSSFDREDMGCFDEEEGGDLNEGRNFGEEEAGKECQMPGVWNKVGSVQNSEDSGLEDVPNVQEEPSIIDSVSSSD